MAELTNIYFIHFYKARALNFENPMCGEINFSQKLLSLSINLPPVIATLNFKAPIDNVNRHKV